MSSGETRQTERTFRNGSGMMKILVIDDEPAVRYALTRIL
jgi:hypothetical protein